MNKCKVASFPDKGKSCSPLAGCRCPKNYDVSTFIVLAQVLGQKGNLVEPKRKEYVVAPAL